MPTAEALKEWETLHRWEWFRREQWRPTFREAKAGKVGALAAFKKILGESAGQVALHSTCGLGLQTIMLKEMGMNVVGCDGCDFAVEKARELARLEGHQIEFCTARWSEPPWRTERRFDAAGDDEQATRRLLQLGPG